MSRIEAAIERLRALSVDEQEKLASEIENLLSEPSSILSRDQWLEVEQELDTDDGVRIPHAEVMSRMRAKFGR
ncbi:MAG: hypothetical protein Q8R02_02120 [Hyphomonadaceae bacterium]|nr:hypothetical protein [Hyphomonadaceae bacterium]